jgi:Tfp pilus assembly protein PilF
MLIWFPVTLIPVVVYPLVVMFQEHRGYFSVMGLAGALGIGVWRVGSAVTRPTARRLAAVGLGAVLVASALATVQRNAVWRDEISLWSDAAAKAPGGATGHINLGVGYLHAGDLGRAEASFRRALVVDPAHPLVYYNLGQVALRREHADEARAWFRRALALAPRSWEAHYALGEAEMAGGRLEDAATAFGQAVALNPRDAKAHARLGVLAQQVGDDASAEAAYLTALRDDPDNPEVLNNLGAIYLGRREWARALDLLTTAVRRDPDYVDAAYNRALALDALGRTAEARTALLGVLDRLPVEPRFEPRRRAVLALLNEGGS